MEYIKINISSMSYLSPFDCDFDRNIDEKYVHPQ
jgi:hypothetical protein